LKDSFLVIVDSVNPNSSSGANCNYNLIANLVALNFIVDVLHFSGQEIGIEGANTIQICEKRFSLMYFASRTIRVIRRYTNINLSPFFERIFGFSFTFLNQSSSIKVILEKLNLSGYKMCLTLSQGESFLPHHAVLSFPDLHNKWLSYVHDPYPMYCYPTEYAYRSPGYKQKIIFFQRVIDSCKYLAFPSLLLSKWMMNYYVRISDKARIIPHQICSKNELFIDTEISNQLDIEEDNFIVLHAGSLLDQRNPSNLINGFIQFLENNDSATFYSRLIIIGSFSERNKLLADEYKEHPNIQFIMNRVPLSSIKNLQKIASLNVILESNDLKSPFLPGKFPDLISVNRRIIIIGPRKSEVRRLMGEDYEFYSSSTDTNRIEFIIEQTHNDWLKSNRNLTEEYSRLFDYMSSANLKEIITELF